MKKSIRILWLLAIALLIVPSYTFSAQAAAKKQNKKYTVVIDAGHGGKDIGAADNGVREKDINLAVALKVGNLIKKKLGDVNVLYTRDKDEFLSLQQRADIANNAHADLFISIHTNSVDQNNPNRTTVSGASVYTLGMQKSEQNMSVARRENSVISLEANKTTYQGFNPDTDESYIIFEMAQKNNVNNSLKFATDVQEQLVKLAKRKDRHVQQAGFWVLWATSMPSALIELDFICNPTEAEFLSSADGQDKLANAIYQGVKIYFNDLKKQSAGKSAGKEETDADPEGFSSDAVIASSDTQRTVTDAPAQRNKNNDAPRRRRNDASRQASAERELDVATIDVPTVQEYSTPIAEQKTNRPVAQQSVKAIEPSAEPEVAPVDDTAMAVGRRRSRTVNVEKNDVASQTKETESEPEPEVQTPAARQNMTSVKKQEQDRVVVASNSPARQSRDRSVQSKLNSYYCVQLFESSEMISANDEMLKGINGKVNVHKQDNRYIYTVGHCSERQDTVPLINDVKDRFPQAKTVRVNAGTNKIVQ